MWDHGWPELISVKQPAVGATAARKIPGETYEGVLVARATLVTSAAVANRFPALELLDGDGSVIFRVTDPTAVPAGTTRTVSWVRDIGITQTSGAGFDLMPFSSIVFPPGFQLRWNVDAMDVGDQLSAIKLYVHRIPSAQWAPSTGSTPYES